MRFEEIKIKLCVYISFNYDSLAACGKKEPYK